MKNFSRPDFVVSIEGFSGPLDLLCALVESKKFEASRVKITQLIKLYGAYLASNKNINADVLAEFFYMASGLLLEKTKSLLSKSKNADAQADDLLNEDFDLSGEDINININDNNIMERIARYRPYRKAFLWLADRLESEAKSFRRPVIINKNNNLKQQEKIIDLSYDEDIFSLAKIWRNIYKNYNLNKSRELELAEEESGADWDGFDKNAPDEEQIQIRIAELEDKLSANNIIYLNALCSDLKNLVVTLLALLEMCRMGGVEIKQDNLFGDVKIFVKDAAA
ncbi:MAG: segregation/condensation protein A [Synergistaceae bacterium]|nr:segregation/condensation protein A [Synergistaceae bacterium]MBR0096868.1 segregation/condensation protein A [Synergistaceae bacterium]